MLEVEGLQAGYGRGLVLRELAFTVREGELVCLLGRNGAGKSTTLKTVMGLVRPTAGSIRYRGTAIGGWPPERVCRLGIGYVPEDRRVFPDLSVEENLRMGFFQSPGVGAEARNARLEQLYGWFPRLGERRGQPGRTLSGGEQQMLAIARALAGAPRLLLVDEPSEGLAPMVVDEIFAAIARARSQGVSVLLVEQNVRRALQVGDRAYVMEKGQAVATGPAATLLDDADVRRRLSV